MHEVFASLQHNVMHKGEDTTQLNSQELVDEFLEEHFAPMVGAVEVPIKQVINTHPDQAKAAIDIDKELHAMHEQRHRLVPAVESTLTKHQKKHALKLCMAMTWKRPTPEQTETAKKQRQRSSCNETLQAHRKAGWWPRISRSSTRYNVMYQRHSPLLESLS